MTDYVVGFMFDKNLEKVLLIKKNRPEWQKGKLNGVGGHVEKGELFRDAMTREFQEETGLYVPSCSWNKIINISGDMVEHEFSVSFYYIIDDLEKCKTMTDEELIICDIKNLPDNVISNLRWIIPLALDEDFYKYYRIDF